MLTSELTVHMLKYCKEGTSVVLASTTLLLIFKQLWTKEVEEPEVKNSYQNVFELREKLEDTLSIIRLFGKFWNLIVKVYK